MPDQPTIHQIAEMIANSIGVARKFGFDVIIRDNFTFDIIDKRTPDLHIHVPTHTHAEIVKTTTVQEKLVVSRDGSVCTNCGGPNLRRSGTCHVCDDCGTSQGCS